MVYQRCGGIPTDDEEMIDAVKDAAHVVEELDEELKGSKKRTLEVREDRTKDKNKHKENVRPKEVQHKNKFKEKRIKGVLQEKSQKNRRFMPQEGRLYKEYPKPKLINTKRKRQTVGVVVVLGIRCMTVTQKRQLGELS